MVMAAVKPAVAFGMMRKAMGEVEIGVLQDDEEDETEGNIGVAVLLGLEVDAGVACLIGDGHNGGAEGKDAG